MNSDKSVLIRQIPERTLEALKRRARRHRRSLQQEILILLEGVARMHEGEKEETVHLNLHQVRSARKSQWGREEIYEEEDK